MRTITLPDWNDLPEPVRMAVCDEARAWDEHIGGDMAVNVYRKLKDMLYGLNLDNPAEDEPMLFETEIDNDQLLNIREVSALVGLAPRTVYAALKRGDFPRQISLTPGRVAWSKREVHGWIRRRTRGGPVPGFAQK